MSRPLRRALTLATAAVALLPAAAEQPTTLHQVAAATGRYFGATVDVRTLTRDQGYAALAEREFGSVTPENVLQADATEPQRNVFVFTSGDAARDWALAHGKRIRGTALVWHAMRAAWVASLTGPELRAAMVNHVEKLMGHYRGQFAAWDVVNEAFDDQGRRRNSNLERTGSDWIEAAFTAARAADPTAKLCYNDYGIEDWSRAKTQSAYALVKDLKARGVPIDCVGFESHFSATLPLPANFTTTLAAFAALGVEVALTELDVEGAAPATYASAVSACLAVPRCEGITVSGIRDIDSWRSGSTPTLFDRTGTPKPAYAAVLAALTPVEAAAG